MASMASRMMLLGSIGSGKSLLANYLSSRHREDDEDESWDEEKQRARTIHLQVRLVDDKQHSRRVECAVCARVCWQPLMTPCGHLFCTACLPERCPYDDTSISRRECTTLQQNPSLLAMFSLLELRCPAAPSLCTWRGTHPDAEAHVRSCGFLRVHCAHPRCPVSISQKDVAAHERVCKYRRRKCEFCKETIEHNEASHEAKCSKKRSQPTSDDGKREDGEEYELVSCLVCRQKYRRGGEAEHLASARPAHWPQLMMLLQQEETRVSRLEKKLDELKEQVETKRKVREAEQKAKEEEEEAVDESGLDRDEINTIMVQASTSRARAVQSLRRHGNLVDAILELTP